MSRSNSLDRASVAIGEANKLALACHIGPDGDALGSMLGFGIAARDADKSVAASFGEPFSVPENLAFLPTDILVRPGSLPAQPEVMVVFDVGSAERLGELAENANSAGTLVVLDHHVTNQGFGDIMVIDDTAAATGEIVFDLLRVLKWPITAEIANCLHTALVTDTGRFTYSNTTPRTLQIASELVELGANTTEIGRHVYEEAPFGYLKAAGAALARAELDADRSVVSTVITQQDLDDADIDWSDIDGLMDTLRLAEEADVAILAKAHADGRVKVSLRSRGSTDVGALALRMGGGGHKLAAGFTVDEEVDSLLPRLVAVIEEYR